LSSLPVLALVDTVVTSSRGSLPKLGLPVIFLWLLIGRITRRRLAILVVAGVASVLLHPFASAVRIARIQSVTGSVWDILSGAAVTAWSGNLLDSASVGGQRVANRVVGAEGVWFSLSAMPDGFDTQRIRAHLTDEPITNYYTRRVVGVTSPFDFRSPGLVGFAMLVGGGPGVVVIPSAFVLFVYAVWRQLARLRSSPVALSIWMMSALLLAMEGTFPLASFVMPLAGVGIAELVYRGFFADGPARGRTRPEQPGRADLWGDGSRTPFP
jgi:hypothetical protein